MQHATELKDQQAHQTLHKKSQSHSMAKLAISTRNTL
jgi:hypothetical protein